MNQAPYTPGQPEKKKAGTDLALELTYDVTESQIHQTAEALEKIRPTYAPLIQFYSRVFMAQALSGTGLNQAPIIIDAATLLLKRENEMPLISPDQFNIDLESAEKLMDKICRLAVAHAPKLAQAGEDLADRLSGDSKEKPDLEALFSALLDSRDITDLADKTGISVDALGFFGFSAMSPSIQANAAQLGAYLKETAEMGQGYCPICGSQPDLSFLGESGDRRACCSLCNHIWETKRMGCLFCDSTDREDQHYFYSKEEPEFRVYCCDHCKHYLKTVDTRQIGRRFFPKLEKVTPLHLDIQAREKGYRQAGEITP
jgi:FdhE protein